MESSCRMLALRALPAYPLRIFTSMVTCCRRALACVLTVRAWASSCR